MKEAHFPYQLAAEVCEALANPTRLEILGLLREGEACVCHIQAKLGQRQAYISQHLNVLRQAGLVTSRKDGLRVYYQVTDLALYKVLDHLKDLLQSLGYWTPMNGDEDDLDRASQPCNCPQCQTKREQMATPALTEQGSLYG
jgi:ArsR family transcriptional regulator